MSTAPSFTFKSAKRLQGFEKKRVQDVFTPLALETNSVNLGQAFPNWQPPSFFQEALTKYVSESSHQYTRSYGHQRLINSLASFYSPLFNRKIDPLKNVLVSNGGIACLCNIFLSVVDAGDEVILIDPSFDCYRAQITMAGGKPISVPLFPKNKITKQDIVNRDITKLKHTQQDEWDLDWDQLENAFNKKTKAILINSPHNPTGKIFTEDELKRIANIVKKHERVVVIFDMVYEAHAYDRYKPLQIPRIATLPGMWERTISVGSAGKLFSATGVRIGWAIGPELLVKSAAGFHQYSGFCLYGPLQEAIADTLDFSVSSNYFDEFNQKLKQGRTKLVQELVNSPMNISIYIPEGGCSVLVDIDKVEIPKGYSKDPEGKNYTKDWAFCMWLCKEKRVVALPCSAFYPEEHQHIGQNLIRVAFCKTPELLTEAGKRISSIDEDDTKTLSLDSEEQECGPGVCCVNIS